MSDRPPRRTEQAEVLAVIAVGGAIGSLARWGLAQLVPHQGDQFPWATLLANVSGALLLGVLMVFVLDVWAPSPLVRPFLGVGVLGGYTTFSTAMLDTRTLLADHQFASAVTYVVGSVVAGLFAVWLGARSARLITGRSS